MNIKKTAHNGWANKLTVSVASTILLFALSIQSVSALPESESQQKDPIANTTAGLGGLDSASTAPRTEYCACECNGDWTIWIVESGTNCADPNGHPCKDDNGGAGTWGTCF